MKNGVKNIKTTSVIIARVPQVQIFKLYIHNDMYLFLLTLCTYNTYILCTYYVPTYLHSATFVFKLSFFSFVHTFMDYSFVIILATLCKNTSRFTYTSHSIFGMFLNFTHSCGCFLQFFLRNSLSKKKL